MVLDVFGVFNVNILYVLITMAGCTLVSVVLAVIAICKSVSMKKKYTAMMQGSNGKNIENIIKEYISDIKELKDISGKNEKAVEDIYEKLEYAFRKVGIVKYDAFHEMGGKLSFALCMLDTRNNGYVVNVMHSNTGCFAYIKEIVNGQSYIELGGEEAKALEQAISGNVEDVGMSDK